MAQVDRQEGTSNLRADSILQSGTVVAGRYEVVQCLGTGTMGVVYLCRNLDLDGMHVALKVLAPFPCSEGNAGNFLHRFRHEILAMCRVNHSNVVSTYESIFEPDLTAFTMEYVNGGTLNSLLRFRRPMHPSRAVSLLIEICAGVDAIHKAGIIHRDIKPENILLSKEGHVKITDFGIARSDLSPNITAPGSIVGTVEYLSPQYLRDSIVDAQGDIYAIGALAYEMITGRAAFKGDTFYQTVELILSGAPTSPSKICTHCPSELSDIILKALAREKENRYQTASAIGQDLLQLLPSLKDIKFETLSTPTFDRRQRRKVRLAARRYNVRRRITTIAASLMIGLSLPLLVAGVGTGRISLSPNQLVIAENMAGSSVDDTGTSVVDTISASSAVERQIAMVVSPASMKFEDAKLFTAPNSNEASLVRVSAPIEKTVTLAQNQRTDDSPRAMLKPRAMTDTKALEPQIVRPKSSETSERASTMAVINRKIDQDIAPAPKLAVVSPDATARIASAPSEQPLPGMEYRVRATLLYRFADYVAWPSSAFSSPTTPLKICIVGKDPYGSYIDQQVTRARQHGGRTFEVTRLPGSAASSHLATCHILYSATINSAEAKRLFSVVAALPVLTVSEISGVGMIDFVMRDEKVKFEIDSDRASAVNLTLGSMLLDLALRN